MHRRVALAVFLSLIVFAALGSASAFAQVVGPGAQGQPEVPWIKLHLTPAAAPTPALKYRFLPELRDLKPGNAALLYQRSHSPEWYGPLQRNKDLEKSYDWMDLPLDKFPKDEARGLIMQGMMKEI